MKNFKIPILMLMTVLCASLSIVGLSPSHGLAAQCPSVTHYMTGSQNSQVIAPVPGTAFICGEVPASITHYAVVDFYVTQTGDNTAILVSGSGPYFVVWMDANCSVIHTYKSGGNNVGDTTLVSSETNRVFIGSEQAGSFVFSFEMLSILPSILSANLACLPTNLERPVAESQEAELFYDLLGREARLPLQPGVYASSHGRKIVAGL